MSLTLKETVERMQHFLNEHPELADCPVYAAAADQSAFNSQRTAVFVEVNDNHTETIVSFF